MSTTSSTPTTTGADALRPVVDALLSAPLDQLDAAALQAQIAAVTPQVGRLQGWLTAAAGRLDQLTSGSVPDPDTGRPRTVAGWLAQVQHTTAATAGSQLRTARLLQELPLLVDAVLDGVLTPQQAAVLTRLVGKIDQAGLVESPPQLIAVAAAMDPHQLGSWIAHQIATHCEPALDTDDTRARNTRYLTPRRETDGSLFGRFRIPAEDSEALLSALEPLARTAGDSDSRTAGQRRADALIDLVEQVLRHGTLPAAGGLRSQLSYVLPANWAAAQQQHAACAACSSCGPRCADHQPLTFTDTVASALPGAGGVRAEQACATAAWTGPQTRSRIEAILCDARITRILLSPLGQVTGFQPLRDRITPAQRRNLAARDLHCVVRGCTRPPALCDPHHLRRRADGGDTTDNLVHRQYGRGTARRVDADSPRTSVACGYPRSPGNDGAELPRYQSVDALQNALATHVFGDTGSPKKAAGRALGTLVELITFYMIRDWNLEGGLAIERGLPEYGNAAIRHNVEFSLHPASRHRSIPRSDMARSLTSRQMALSAAAAGGGFDQAVLRATAKLLGLDGILRHACNFAEEEGAFWVSYMTGTQPEFSVSRLKERPYAMFECKRVGIEDGMTRGPQTIEKAKQGAYVARSVSGLQRIPRRDGSVAALVEEIDGTLTTHPNYYEFLQGAIDAGNSDQLANVVLTVGVVSNHGNWFTAETQNKEMRVLAQSYDWLLFLTDLALAEFIEDVLQGEQEELAATRAAFKASFGRAGGVTQFTKVTIGMRADQELTNYFAHHQPWSRWYNVISPEANIDKLRDDLLRLQEVHNGAWGAA